MGGKSRKAGTVSKELIRRLKSGIQKQRRNKWKSDVDYALSIRRMKDKILEGIERDREDWNRKLADLKPDEEGKRK